jgi:hypothetical protein
MAAIVFAGYFPAISVARLSGFLALDHLSDLEVFILWAGV